MNEPHCPECACKWCDSGTAVLVKALKPKGSDQSIKQGTKVKNIHLIPGDNYNIYGKISESGEMMPQSGFVKKVRP